VITSSSAITHKDLEEIPVYHNDQEENSVTSTNNSNFDGTFDEEASHREFLEALYEWRGMKKVETQTPSTIIFYRTY
jgi:hypothetical protein